MNKKERQALVLELIEKETPESDIIAQVVEASGSKEATVLKDIKELSEQTPEAESEVEIIVIDLPKARNGETFEWEKKEDKNHAFVYQEQVNFNGSSGLRTSKGFAQAYGRSEWENFRKYGPTIGWSIVPLSIPEGWSEEVGQPLSSGTVRIDPKPEPKK